MMQDRDLCSFSKASPKPLLYLLPEVAGQADVKYVCGYDAGQGTEIVKPFQVQGAFFFFAQAPRHELWGLFGAPDKQADRLARTDGLHTVVDRLGQEENTLERNSMLHIPGAT